MNETKRVKIETPVGSIESDSGNHWEAYGYGFETVINCGKSIDKIYIITGS